MMTENKHDAQKIFETRRAPGFLFNALSKTYDARTARALKPLGLNAPHWPVLDQIYLNPGINQRELAALCLRDPSTLVNSIDTLEKDRRSTRLHITEEGVATRNAAFATTRALFEKATENISQEDIDHLYDTCLAIYSALQQIDD